MSKGEYEVVAEDRIFYLSQEPPPRELDALVRSAVRRFRAVRIAWHLRVLSPQSDLTRFTGVPLDPGRAA